MVVLRARPAVKVVNRGIKIPKTVRTVLRPNPAIVRQLQKVNQDVQIISRKQPRSIQQGHKRITPARPNAAVATPRTPRSIGRIRAIAEARRPRNIKRRSPVVRYTSAEMTPQSKKAISSIKNVGKGKVLVIIGNGPSLIEADIEKLTGHPHIHIMSINKPASRVWPTKYWLFCDHTQFKRHQDLWQTYGGTIFNTTAIKQKRKNAIQIRNLGGTGFSKDLLNGFYLGRSSCFAAMQVALWMGYDHIYLFGVDMRSVRIDGEMKTHYYGVNPDVQPKNREARFDQEAKHYDHAAETLSDSDRKRFTFCSSYLRYKFADKFKRIDHRKAVGKILQKVGANNESELQLS